MFGNNKKKSGEHGYSYNPDNFQVDFPKLSRSNKKIKTMGERQYQEQWNAPKAPKLNANATSYSGYAYNHQRQDLFDSIPQDEQIYNEVCEALTKDSSIDASDIQVSVNDGIVTLSGTVSERLTKLMVEECLNKVSNINAIINNLHLPLRTQITNI